MFHPSYSVLTLIFDCFFNSYDYLAIQEQQVIIASQKTQIETEKEINKKQIEQLEALLKRLEKNEKTQSN